MNNVIDGTQVRDLVILGAGSRRFGRGVYAASEGLNVLMIETLAPGGQAGSTSKIEKYLGIPDGSLGAGTGVSRGDAGAEVWREHDDRMPRRAARLRRPPPYEVVLDTDCLAALFFVSAVECTPSLVF